MYALDHKSIYLSKALLLQLYLFLLDSHILRHESIILIFLLRVCDIKILSLSLATVIVPFTSRVKLLERVAYTL